MTFLKEWQKFLDEVDPAQVDISSFEVKDSLNPDIWENEELIEEVRQKLIGIVAEFFDDTELTFEDFDDISFTGSLANYNWSEFSDIDLHIIIDFMAFGGDAEYIKKYFTEKRINWNKAHNIKIKGHDVEIYVQDSAEAHMSSGVYSILHNEWVTQPLSATPSISWQEVQLKAADLMEQIDELEAMFKQGNYSESDEFAAKLKEKIKKFRKTGLEQGGEFSVENIAFKTLRRNGYLEKLSRFQTDSYDQTLSLPESEY
jgi:hypothetical protein